MPVECCGLDVLSGAPVRVIFDTTIQLASTHAGHARHCLAPGWIDLQVNGFAGVDYNSPSTPHQEIARSIRVLFSTGVTRFYPTVITGAPDDMLGALKNLAAARERLEEGAAIEGFHVEGPHISPDDGPRGAHPRRWVRRPDLHEFHRWQEAAGGLVRIVTLAPEWPEALRYIEALVAEGVVVSIGHTNATPAQIEDAVRAGASMSTHIGNGCHAQLPRHASYVEVQLAEDRLSAGFIVDGIHLAPSFLKVALRAKGPDRSILVTDAAPPAGAAPGRYRIGEQEIDLTADGRVVLAGQDLLAGSALRMDRGVANLVRLAGINLADAVRMATLNPARAARIAGRENGLAPGDRGDLVEFEFEPEMSIRKTWLAGKLVYSAET